MSRTDPLNEYYTLPGAAAALGLSYWQVYRLARSGRVPVTRLGSMQVVRLADLRAVVALDADGRAVLTETGRMLEIGSAPAAVPARRPVSGGIEGVRS